MLATIIDCIGIRCLSLVSRSVIVKMLVYVTPLLLAMLRGKSITKSIATSD